jgi:HEAT repeat protein
LSAGAASERGVEAASVEAGSGVGESRGGRRTVRPGGVGGEGGSAEGEVVVGRRAALRSVSAYEDEVVRSVLREDAISVLEDAVASGSALLRANGLEGMRWAPSRLRAALGPALRDENAGVRFAAGMLAGEFRERSVIGGAWGLLEDEDPRVRMAGIYALSRMGEDVSRTPLARYLSHPEAMVRRQAVFVLGELGDPSAAPLLRDARRLARGSGDRERTALEDALLRLFVAEALLKLGMSDVESVLRSALYPGSLEEVEASVLAVQVIGEQGVRQAMGQLRTIVRQGVPGHSGGGDPRERSYLWPIELRLASALALAKMGELGGVFTADLAFDHEEASVRGQAAFVYGEAGRSIDLAKLELLMEDPSPLVRVSAAAATLRALSGGDG